ncbi:hypothetical protein [Actinomyces bowdenii]|uniref:hypothetical protein n=1 Tax=Actinomyces bowdenii TaxID=131109 RepID=UPI001FCFC5A3|nr:hypothetical protein [Actinomyces bowdenii]
MVQRLLSSDPQAAYAHARYAASCAGRIAVVRETAGIAAYLCGQYTEALREIRAARRLSGLDLHRAIEADCERALGHHSKALKAASEADPRQLDDIERAELAMVLSGIREEMGQTELGLIIIEDAIRARPRDRETLRRLHSVRADRLEALGRVAEAQAIRERIGPEPEELEEDIEVFDIQDEIGDWQEAPLKDRAEAHRAAEAQEPEGSAAQDGGPDRLDSFAQRVEAEMRELLGEDAASDEATAPHRDTAQAEGTSPQARPGSSPDGVPETPSQEA